MKFYSRQNRRTVSPKRRTAKLRLERLDERLLLSGFGAGDGGYIVEPWVGGYSAVQIQPGDQKIVAAGDDGTDQRMAIARYDSLGNPDNTYGSGGPSIPPLSGVSAPELSSSSEYGRNLVLQPDGKAVLAGYSSTFPNSSFVVARFNTNGALDSGFGSGGSSSLDVRTSDFNPAFGVGLQSTGKVVVAGFSLGVGNAGGYNPAEVARFTASGAVDSGKGAFGDVVQGKAVGYTLTTFGMLLNSFSDLAVQPDDKLVAVGLTTPNSPNSQSLIVARYTASGTLDKTFNGNGYSLFLPAGISDAVGAGVALQSDGKIVVTGSCTGSDGASDMLVARYNPNGTLDTSFGGGTGYVRLDDGAATPSTEYGHDVAIQPDGKIVVAGQMDVTGNPTSVMVARLNGDGTPDGTFAPGGFKVADPLPNTSFVGSGVSLLSDGSIIVAGGESDLTTNIGHPFLMRFLPTTSSPQPAAGGAAAASSRTAPMTLAQMQPVLTEAVARPQPTAASISGLGSLDFRITNPPDATIDVASGNTITLDSSPAGWGWFVGHSPRRGRVPQAGRLDPLSTLTTTAV